ncbi:uncharacterized protein LOC131229204 [Magnolia sinica]|uniref:uncharacterized protein LOC131229204 n=1 Tax=Magnolia sinica TaxID=86752 RepID=UPI002657D7B5|nr:uncharacterized protein LOC131229204 [Magnolia sinica]
MALQSVSCSHFLPNLSLNNISKKKSFSNPPLSFPSVSTACISLYKNSGSGVGWRIWRVQSGDAVKCHNVPTFCFEKLPKRKNAVFYSSNSDTGTAVGASDIGQVAIESSSKNTTQQTTGEMIFDRREPFRGKSGSISFCGLTHQLVEERKLESSPFKEGTGSFVWVLAPIALISSLLLPQFFFSNIEAVLDNEVLADIIISLASEAMFYTGIAAFLLVTDHVQRPYLQFSHKRWGLITGLRGYLTTAFFIMGFKIFAPLLAVYVVWPMIGLPAVVAVTPFLLGCAAQSLFEAYLDKRGSSCWPLVHIIFEVYRLYQLSRAAHFIERLMLSLKGRAVTPALLEMSSAYVSMVAVFQVLGIVCLWSLTTFLLRLFPSRPVAEKY